MGKEKTHPETVVSDLAPWSPPVFEGRHYSASLVAMQSHGLPPKPRIICSAAQCMQVYCFA